MNDCFQETLRLVTSAATREDAFERAAKHASNFSQIAKLHFSFVSAVILLDKRYRTRNNLVPNMRRTQTGNPTKR